MALFLIRHPPVEVESGVCYGRLDVEPIAESAWPNGVGLGRLPALDAIVSSPARRCSVVARWLSLRHGREPTLDPSWRELDFGAWEGRRWSDIPREESDHWLADYWNRSPPGGESYRLLSARVLDAFERLVSGTVAVVTHNGPIKAVIAHCMAQPRERLPDILVPPGAIMCVERNGDAWEVRSWSP